MAQKKMCVQGGFLPGQKVKCLYSQYEVCEGKLNFTEDEILIITGEDLIKDQKWYRSKNSSGNEGLIPVKSVMKHEDLPATVSNASEQNETFTHEIVRGDSIGSSYPTMEEIWRPGERVECQYERCLDEIEEEDLPFSVGEILTIVEQMSKDWLIAKNSSGRQGWIPSNYVQKQEDLLSMPSNASAQNETFNHETFRRDSISSSPSTMEEIWRPGQRVRCQFECCLDEIEEDDLPFSVGEILTIVEQMSKDWLIATNSSGRQGWIPSNYVQKQEDLLPMLLNTWSQNETFTHEMVRGDSIGLNPSTMEMNSNIAGPNSVGLNVPVQPVREKIWTPGQKVECLYDRTKNREDELSFTKRQILTIVKAAPSNWYVAQNSSEREGLIPATFVKAIPWFHGRIQRQRAEELLKTGLDGSFLVRESLSLPGDYILSVWSGNEAKHYRICSEINGYTIDTRDEFSTLSDLIEHYCKDVDTLYTRLTEEKGTAEQSRHKKDEVLPREILCMDENSQKLYRSALEAGKERIYNIRVMIVGHHGVGKTALTKRLMHHKQIRNERKPTQGIEVHARCCQIDHYTKEWKTGNTDLHLSNAQRIAGILRKHVGEKTNTEAEYDGYVDCISKTSASSNIKLLPKPPASNTKPPPKPPKPNTKPLTKPPMSTTERSQPIYVNVTSDEGTYSDVFLPEGMIKEYSESCEGKNEQSDIYPAPSTNNSLGLENERILVNCVEEIDKLVQRTRCLTLPKNPTSDVTLLDFAGHFMFYTTHQAFMSWRTLYLLVTDIRMSLMDTIQDDACCMDFSGDKTGSMQDYVMYWLNAIHSHALLPFENEMETGNKHKTPEGSSEINQEPCIRSPSVILVATHTDTLTKEEVEKKKTAYFCGVRETLKNSPLRFHLIDEDFAISNITCDHRIDDLQSKIFEIAKQQDYWGEEVPARWLPLEQKLMELKKQGIPIIDYTELEKLNMSLQVKIESSEELELFLKFEYDLGNIVYFRTEKLRGKVVLDPEWLMHGVKTLVASEKILKTHPELSKDWYDFKDTGRLTKRLIGILWLKESEEYHTNQQHLLDLMVKLNIMAQPLRNEEENNQDDYYWVPCMVHKTASEAAKSLVKREDVTKTSTLCFESKTKFIHVGVFHRLLASCLLKWSPTKAGEKYFLFSGFCVFELDDCHNLILSLVDYVIHATIIRFTTKKKPPEISLCIVARDYLQSTLSDISSYLCPNSEFQICIKCNDSATQSNEGLHKISSLREKEDIRCSGHEYIHAIDSNQLLGFWENNDAKIPKNLQTAQSALATDRFMRIYSLLVDVGAKVLRRLLHFYTVKPHTTLDQYLQNHSTAIADLKKKKVLNQSQIDIMFPQTGDTDIRRYDITLLTALLNNIVPQLGQKERQSISDLRNDRNQMMHRHSTKMSNHDFQTTWTRVTTTLTDISNHCGDTAFKEEINQQIGEIDKPGSNDILSRMESYEEDLKKMRADLDEIKKSG